MKGHGVAYGAGTVINAIAAWKGCAFAIDLRTEATVTLRGDLIEGEIAGGGDTGLIERACELTLDALCVDSGARVRTTSGIPVASGLKSSSAAANATVIATARAAGRDLDPLEAVRIGVRAALDAGVSITGAFDDACASMLGGIVLTDNREKTLLRREAFEADVVVYVPDRQAFSAQTDVRRSRLVAPWVEMAFDAALRGDYRRAMTLNGFLYCSALGFSPEPMLAALDLGITGVSLSGTGPAFVALVAGEQADRLKAAWSAYPGRVLAVRTVSEGAYALL
ncbi:MAG TPA: shikimate kinase [Methanocella sp.]|nr:shikimate kinase [Methanocella sp.]